MKDAVEGSLGETKDRVGNSDGPHVGFKCISRLFPLDLVHGRY